MCVCVEGEQTAGMFNSMFEMMGVKNVILEGNPGFGQLGCSGFVLLDRCVADIVVVGGGGAHI